MDQQVVALRDIIVHVAHGTPTDGSGTESRAVVALDEIKRDVVDTIRRVVEVVSTYAGAALPENARRFVRQSILSLPVRWTQSMSASDAPTTPTGAEPEGHRSAANAAAERLLVFAVESLDMLRSLTQIFGDSAERAELCVGALCAIETDAIQLARPPEDRRSRPASARSGRRRGCPARPLVLRVLPIQRAHGPARDAPPSRRRDLWRGPYPRRRDGAVTSNPSRNCTTARHAACPTIARVKRVERDG